MVELRLMRESEARKTAEILANSHTSFHEIDYELRHIVIDDLIKRAAGSVDQGPTTIVALSPEGIIVGAYELQPLFRKEDKISIADYGYLATSPSRKGHGSAIIRSLQPIFEQMAVEAGASFLEHKEITLWNTSLFQQCEYSYMGAVDTGKYYQRFFVRNYNPVQHNLSNDGKRIIEQMLSRTR
jgi:hypothetical protein